MRNIALIALLLISACVAARPNPPLQPVTCIGKEDCEVKWGRALTWVQQHSAYTLQQASDMLIATNGPLPDDTHAAYTVTKVPQGHGRAVIHFQARSGNIVWGCLPNCYDQAADFRSYITSGE